MTSAFPNPAQVLVDTRRTIGPISPLLFGGFVEHLGRCVYGGIYDPGSPHADEGGLRTDLLSLFRDEMRLTTIRYPGGNYVSGHDWIDSVGPVHQRPRRRDLAWRSVEPNRFGLNEFMGFCRKIKAEPMLGINFGTAGLAEASQLVEYCNAPVGTKYADLRASHGYRDPHAVKYWCLGNEMDGPWQIGQMDAASYAIKAREVAKVIRWHDREVQLILCGSSHPDMPTYPEWDRVVLEECWEHVDYLAMHHYADNWAGDTPAFLAYGVKLEQHVDTLAGTLRYVKAKRRSKRDVYLSWDEWNVWYKDRDGDGNWQVGPHLCEEVYNLEDALVVAQWINVFLRRCDVVRAASMAQVVNVIAPILARPEGLLKQSIYYPFVLFRRFAGGDSLDVHTTSPLYHVKAYGDVPTLDASASHDAETGRLSVFLVNRSTTDHLPTEIHLADLAPAHFDHVHQLSGRDPKAANSWDHPDRVVPAQLRTLAVQQRRARLLLPPLSLTVLSGSVA